MVSYFLFPELTNIIHIFILVWSLGFLWGFFWFELGFAAALLLSVLTSEFQVILMRENTCFLNKCRSIKKKGRKGEHVCVPFLLFLSSPLPTSFTLFLLSFGDGWWSRTLADMIGVIHSNGYREKSKRYRKEISNTEVRFGFFLSWHQKGLVYAVFHRQVSFNIAELKWLNLSQLHA